MAPEEFDSKLNGYVLRRKLLRGVGAAVGAAVLAPRLAGAQAPPSGPVGAAQHRHAAAARLQSPRRARPPTSPIPTCSPSTRRSTACASPTRRSSGCGPARCGPKGPAWNSVGPLPRVERHPEQPAAALDRGRRPRQRVPRAVEQQQRQHLRLPGPAALVRAPHAARGALRARRLGDRHRVDASTASGSTRRTTSCRIRTAATGSPTRPTARSSTKARSTPPAGPANKAGGSTRGSASRPRSAATSASCRPRCTASTRAARSTQVAGEDLVPDPNGLCFSPDFKKLYVVSTGKGPGDTHRGRQGRHVRVRRRRRQQADATASSSATSWSTA